MTPGSDEVLDEVYSHVPEAYIERLDGSANALSSALAASTVYLECGGRKHLGEAFRIGELLGLNTRIVDDLMDGENVAEVNDREAFLNNYIRSIQGEEANPVEHDAEKAAYTAGRILGENTDRDVMASYMKDVRDIAVVEDKSSRKGYSSYSRGISATIGEITGLALEEIEDFNADTETLNFSYDLAYIGQIADDKLDGDTGLSEEEINRFYRESIQRMNRHGVKGKLIGHASALYPTVYRGLKAAKNL